MSIDSVKINICLLSNEERVINPSVNSLCTYKQVSHHTFLHGSTSVAGGEKLMMIRPDTTGGCLPLRNSQVLFTKKQNIMRGTDVLQSVFQCNGEG